MRTNNPPWQIEGYAQSLPPGACAYDGRNIRLEDARVQWSSRKKALTFPDGKVVALQKKLDKGHASEAWISEDDWVYVFTNTSLDASKDILDELRRRELRRTGQTPAYFKHLPWVEHVDWVDLGRGRFGARDLYRMPLYYKLTDPGLREEARITRKAFRSAFNRAYSRVRTESDIRQAWVELILKEQRISQTLRDAISRLHDALYDYGEGWQFESPDRNLAQDESGNLVLLDVFFNADRLDTSRGLRR